MNELTVLASKVSANWIDVQKITQNGKPIEAGGGGGSGGGSPIGL